MRRIPVQRTPEELQALRLRAVETALARLRGEEPAAKPTAPKPQKSKPPRPGRDLKRRPEREREAKEALRQVERAAVERRRAERLAGQARSKKVSDAVRKIREERAAAMQAFAERRRAIVEGGVEFLLAEADEIIRGKAAP